MHVTELCAIPHDAHNITWGLPASSAVTPRARHPLPCFLYADHDRGLPTKQTLPVPLLQSSGGRALPAASQEAEGSRIVHQDSFQSSPSLPTQVPTPQVAAASKPPGSSPAEGAPRTPRSQPGSPHPQELPVKGMSRVSHHQMISALGRRRQMVSTWTS